MTLLEMFEAYHRAKVTVPKIPVTPKQKQLLKVLAETDDWITMKEIAAITGINYNTLRETFDRLESKKGIDVKRAGRDKPRLYRKNDFFFDLYGDEI